MGEGESGSEFCERIKKRTEKTIFKLVNQKSDGEDGIAFHKRIIRASPISKVIVTIIKETKCKISLRREKQA